jgi:NADH-quinone oxidoreductase subunit G
VALVSAWNTVEAMASLKSWVAEETPAGNGSAVRIFGYGNPVQADQVFPGFTIRGDKNPNAAGLKQVFGIADATASLKALASESGPIGTLLLAHNVPEFVLTPEFKAVLDRAENVLLLDFADGELLRYGNVAVALPTLTSFEKPGTFVNHDGLAQAFEPVMQPVTYGLPETEIVAAILSERRTQHAASIPARVPT